MGGVVVVAFFDVRYTLRQAIFQEWLDGWWLVRGMRTSRCAWPPPNAGGSGLPFWDVFLRRQRKFPKISFKRDPLSNLYFFYAVVCLELMIKLYPRHMTLFWGCFARAGCVSSFGDRQAAAPSLAVKTCKLALALAGWQLN